MKYKLELLKPKQTTDRMGAERVVYEPTRTVHAERVTTTGNRSEEVGEHFAAYSAQFNYGYSGYSTFEAARTG